MNVTSMRISGILELREIVLSFQNSLNLVNADGVFVSVVVMCCMNEATPTNIPCTCYLAKIIFLCLMSVLSWRVSLARNPYQSITEPRYLMLVTISSFCPFTLISVLMPLGRQLADIQTVTVSQRILQQPRCTPPSSLAIHIIMPAHQLCIDIGENCDCSGTLSPPPPCPSAFPALHPTPFAAASSQWKQN